MNHLTEQSLQLRRVLAAELLRQSAIEINTDRPYVLTSGNHSPIYVNCRQLISSPTTIKLIVAAAAIQFELNECVFDVIAGGETAGIPFAAFLAIAFCKPMIYVRKTAKSHGTASSVEGVLKPGARVLLVEDLITDGGSKITFVESTRRSGGVVEDVLVVFDRLQGGAPTLAEQGVRLFSLTDLDTVLAIAEEWSILPTDSVRSVRAYLNSPAKWHMDHNLPFSQVES